MEMLICPLSLTDLGGDDAHDERHRVSLERR